MITNQALHMRTPAADCLNIWYQPCPNFHRRALACDECRAKHVCLLSMKRCIYSYRQAITCRQVSQSKTLSAVELQLNVDARSIPYLAACAAFESLVVFGNLQALVNILSVILCGSSCRPADCLVKANGIFQSSQNCRILTSDMRAGPTY